MVPPADRPVVLGLNSFHSHTLAPVVELLLLHHAVDAHHVHVGGGALTRRRDRLCMRSDGPPAFHGIDRGARSAPGSSGHTRGLGVVLSAPVPPARHGTLRFPGSAPPTSARTARCGRSPADSGSRSAGCCPGRHSCNNPGHAATPHGSGDVPGLGAGPRAETTQHGEVPLRRRRVLHRPHRAVPGGVRKPLRRRSRKSGAPRTGSLDAVRSPVSRCGSPRRLDRLEHRTPLAPTIAVGAAAPLRQRNSPTAVALHRLRSTA